MALDATKVRIAITGELFVAPVGSTAPTDATSALDAAWLGLGYVGEDGVTEAYDETIEEIVAWQNAAVVRSNTTESKATLKLKLIETKKRTLELYHKGSTVVTNGAEYKIDVKTPTTDLRAFVLQVVDGTKDLRIYVPTGEVTERGEIVYANGEPVGFEVTLTCYPNASNVVLTKFSDDANFGA